MTARHSDVYWAAQADSSDVVRDLLARRKRYRSWMERSGVTRRALSALRAYYGWGPQGLGDTSMLGTSGMTGEYTEMAVPEFSGLVEQSFAQLTANKAAFMAVPKSGDYDAQASARFADQLLDAYDRDSAVEEVEDEATLIGLLCREGGVALSWDKQGGSTLGLDGRRIVFEGDIRADALLPWDVAYDVDAHHKKDLRWIAFCRPVSRFDLIAGLEPTDGATPEALQRIEQLVSRIRAFDEPTDEFTDVRAFLRGGRDGQSDYDLVPLWEMRHLPTPALPQGRIVRFLDDTAIVFDSATPTPQSPGGVGYPYDSLSVRFFEPSKVVGTAGGHSLVWDLLGMQELVDMVATAGATATSASAVSNIWAPSGANLSVRALADGLNLIESTVKPEALHAIKLDPQAMAFAEACRNWMQRRMGLNDVAMGDPTKGMPAQLAALLDAKVVQFWSRAIKSLSRMRADVRTDIIAILKRFADAPRMATLAGKNNQWALESWNKEKLALVSRVAVEPVSAVSKTLAGKLAMADALLERGLLKTPEEYLAVKSTGKLEKLTEWQDMNLLRIQREKELLRRGVGLPPIDPTATDAALMADPEALPVFAVIEGEFIRPSIVDTPWLDIPEYAAVMASPEARNNPKVMQAVTDAIQFKAGLWRSMPSEIIAALGGYPPPPPGMGGPDVMPADATEAPMPGGESPEGVRRITPPKPPPNPITGEQAPAASDVSQPV